MQIEIEQLNMRLAEAEAKLKTEVARIKKKMQAQITELEMTLDAANKHNLDLQKTIKKQALQITVSADVMFLIIMLYSKIYIKIRNYKLIMMKFIVNFNKLLINWVHNSVVTKLFKLSWMRLELLLSKQLERKEQLSNKLKKPTHESMNCRPSTLILLQLRVNWKTNTLLFKLTMMKFIKN